ncbi:hybrid sensor histidine kinase/response regulator [Sedimenticola hydrogenitrophicus]|uniref:hybrid sensor histidine kinase/response regulator n=1 Tax=Sedimenticola hydrogenitrophicus TaxID=2967975 RepID=UPI0023B091B5
MKLRTQILLFFFAFAFTPLLIAVAINLPLVLERMDLFYQKAHLQNLRADFRDLDQHLASRHEMVRLLAKLPEPGTLLGEEEAGDSDTIDLARTRYIQWINQILQEQLDIVQIVFLDARGDERFWLDRDPENQSWQPTVRRPGKAPETLVSAALQAEPGRVLVSALSLNPVAGALDPRRFMTLRLVTPILGRENRPPIGAVMLNIDVGGIARFYRDTLWVNNDGSFLQIPAPDAPTGNAFARYPGLAALFAEEQPVLWKGANEQIMWVPMFRTERSRSLWVGRRVDPSPIAEFRNALTLRVLSIIFLLMLATWLASRWLAKRAERLSRELIDGIQQILEEETPVSFDWKGPQELKRLGMNLSRLAEEHGRTSRHLRAHARELEESNRYKSQFLANISHELKTPLNSILLLSKLLAGAQHGLSDDQLKQARVIHEAGRDLQALIDNILDLSRIEARRTPLHPQSVAVIPLLQGLVELVQPQFDAKGLSLRLELGRTAPAQITSDPDKLRQILKNFLSNAVKFTETGEAVLRVAAADPADADSYALQISVSDSGIGIPAEQHAEIFEAFKQADGATNRRYGGTGLGLTISRQLARLLGGDIRLRSRPGQGSRFTLLLPAELGPALRAAESAAPEQERPPPSTPETVNPDPYLGRHSVLVVDANLHHLLQLTPLLEQAGLRVTAAESAGEAAELMADEPFALVLIDVIPPGDNGCDTIKRIKQAQPLPVLAILSEAESETEAACLAAGADALIRRPIDPGALHQLLGQLLPAEAVDTE